MEIKQYLKNAITISDELLKMIEDIDFKDINKLQLIILASRLNGYLRGGLYVAEDEEKLK